MGIVLDSSVLIDAERGARSVSDLLLSLQNNLQQTEVVLSAISVVELEHGLHRAGSADVTRKRQAFLDTVFTAIPVQPFTIEMARLAAKIDADAQQQGRRIPFADLLIGVTAMYLGFAVATRNRRDFERIPGLTVREL